MSVDTYDVRNYTEDIRQRSRRSRGAVRGRGAVRSRWITEEQ
jgi:hypothetical protein